MINNKFLYYRTLDSFNRDYNNIKYDSIVFIEDVKFIWTHGVYFGSSSLNNTNIPVIDIDAALDNYYTKSQTYNKSEINSLLGANADALLVIQQIVLELNNSGSGDTSVLEQLFDLIAQKADKSQLELKADKSDYYTKVDSDYKYLTKEEFDDYRYPVKHTLNVTPSSTEYTADTINISISYSIFRTGSTVTPDDVIVYVGNNVVYRGTDSSKTISTTASATSNTIKLVYYIGDKSTTVYKDINFIKPSYMFYSAASTKDAVQLSNKQLWESLNQSILLSNDLDNVYLWLVTPYEKDIVSTDEGKAYIVNMPKVAIDENTGLNYYRSELAIDHGEDIRYWLTLKKV